jgi:hypothetical protein
MVSSAIFPAVIVLSFISAFVISQSLIFAVDTELSASSLFQILSAAISSAIILLFNI